MADFDFDALTEAQQRHLCFAATSNNYQGHRAVMRRLEALGMVEEEESVIPGRFPVRYKFYSVPIHVHIKWAAWCAEKYEDEL